MTLWVRFPEESCAISALISSVVDLRTHRGYSKERKSASFRFTGNPSHRWMCKFALAKIWAGICNHHSNTETTESFHAFSVSSINNLRSKYLGGLPRNLIAMPMDYHSKLLFLRRLSFFTIFCDSHAVTEFHYSATQRGLLLCTSLVFYCSIWDPTFSERVLSRLSSTFSTTLFFICCF